MDSQPPSLKAKHFVWFDDLMKRDNRTAPEAGGFGGRYVWSVLFGLVAPDIYR